MPTSKREKFKLGHYQTLDSGPRRLIRDLARPGEAKRYGRRVPLRPDWDSMRLAVMLDLLQQKFCYPLLRERLLATG